MKLTSYLNFLPGAKKPSTLSLYAAFFACALIACLETGCKTGTSIKSNAFAIPCDPVDKEKTLTKQELAAAAQRTADQLNAAFEARSKYALCPARHAEHPATDDTPVTDGDPIEPDYNEPPTQDSTSTPLVVDRDRYRADKTYADSMSTLIADQLFQSMVELDSAFSRLNASLTTISFKLDQLFDPSNMANNPVCYKDLDSLGTQYPLRVQSDTSRETIKLLCTLDAAKLLSLRHDLEQQAQALQELEKEKYGCYDPTTVQGRNNIGIFLMSYHAFTTDPLKKHLFDMQFTAEQQASLAEMYTNFSGNHLYYKDVYVQTLFSTGLDSLPAVQTIKHEIISAMSGAHTDIHFEDSLEDETDPGEVPDSTLQKKREFLAEYDPVGVTVDMLLTSDTAFTCFMHHAWEDYFGIGHDLHTQAEDDGFKSDTCMIDGKLAPYFWSFRTPSELSSLLGEHTGSMFDYIEGDSLLSDTFFTAFLTRYPTLTLAQIADACGDFLYSPNEPFTETPSSGLTEDMIEAIKQRQLEQYKGVALQAEPWKIKNISLSQSCECGVHLYMSITAPHANFQNGDVQGNYFQGNLSDYANISLGEINAHTTEGDMRWINDAIAEVRNKLRTDPTINALSGNKSFNVSYRLTDNAGSTLVGSPKFITKP